MSSNPRPRDWRSLPRKTQRFAAAAAQQLQAGDVRGALWNVVRHTRSKANQAEALQLLDRLDR